MVDGIVRFVGCVNLVAFFASDFYFAYVLHNLKQDHPSIDECSPGEDDEEVDVAVMSTLQKAVQSIASDSLASSRSGHRGDFHVEDGSDGVSQKSKERSKLIHKAVIVASFSAPLFAFFQIAAPSSMSWSMFDVPTWLGFLSIIPGLGACMFYASRALRVAGFEDVSKSQWLSMMWFRLDMMCVMGVVMLLGWGDWLLALCLFVVALYLAHRLLVTERRLSAELKHTQLLREEINLETLRPTPTQLQAAEANSSKGYDAIRR